jgi:hypothetical protein
MRVVLGENRPRAGSGGALLTIADVAEELAVCTATVYKLVAHGSRPGV